MGWCDKQQTTHIQPSIAKVVDFLSERFQAGLQYSTLNSYRSAIRSTIPQVGQHPLVCKFKKCTLEWVSFQLAAMTKTGTATKSMEFFFPSFPHNKRLCPVTCLDSYVEGTSAWRVVGDGPQPLFLAIQGPHKAVSSATIGRWLKDIMKEAGIDVDTFKAHST